jgi:hypothetical protein
MASAFGQYPGPLADRRKQLVSNETDAHGLVTTCREQHISTSLRCIYIDGVNLIKISNTSTFPIDSITIMPLQHILFVCAYAIATTNAAVNFYGSDRPDGDYVTCEVTNATDEDVSAALSSFYFPGEVVPDSTDLQFDEELVCGDFASVAVEFACHDLDGESTCISTHTEEDSEPATEADTEELVGRSVKQLTKRAGATCDEFTLRCKNTYPSSSGFCPSDYTLEAFQVSGYPAETWCTKPCTDEEKLGCQDKRCPDSKERCEKNDYVHDCARALTYCAGSPIKMPERSCTLKYVAAYFGAYCESVGAKGLTYEEDSCRLNATAYQDYLDLLAESFQ